MNLLLIVYLINIINLIILLDILRLLDYEDDDNDDNNINDDKNNNDIIIEKNDYSYLIDYPKNYSLGDEKINNIDLEIPLVKTMDEFCQKNNVYQDGAIVSLSGGVDSMVILAILIRLSKANNNFPIYACSINYNQRDEQGEEMDFLKAYCEFNKVIYFLETLEGYSRKKEDSGSRNEFEEESRKVRFNLYNKIIKNHGGKGVFVGHHKDDIIENIFTNSMKGGNLLDLEVMKEISIIHGINIYRPLLAYHKDSIYKLSHDYHIPYFLDTTPKWSRRGKMRNEIFPLLDDVFSKSWRGKIKELGNQSNEWGKYINEYVIDPWYEKIIFQKYGFFLPANNQPKLIYTNVLLKAMHKIGKHMLKNSSVDKIISNKKNVNKLINLDAGFFMYVDFRLSTGIFIFNKEDIQEIINNSPVKLTKEPLAMESTCLFSFLDGLISYKQPEKILDSFTISNKKIYEETDSGLPIELVKHFSFKRVDTDMWVNTGV